MSCCYKEDILRDRHDEDDDVDNGETGMLALRLSIGLPTASGNRPPPTSAEAAVAGGVGGCRVAAATSSPTVSSSSAAGAAAHHNHHQYFRYRPQPPEKEMMMMMSSAAAEAEVVDRVLMSIGDGDDNDGSGGSGARKKLRLTKEQSALLEDRFKEHTTLNPKQKAGLAKQLNLSPRQVEVWFQNRRARTKLKKTEMDCEFLKKCRETLTEENRRLLRELHEIKSAKQPAAPVQQFMQQLQSAALAAACHTCDLPGGPTSSVASTRTRRE